MLRRQKTSAQPPAKNRLFRYFLSASEPFKNLENVSFSFFTEEYFFSDKNFCVILSLKPFAKGTNYRAVTKVLVHSLAKIRPAALRHLHRVSSAIAKELFPGRKRYVRHFL